MQTFIDIQTQQIYQFDDDVMVSEIAGVYEFSSAGGVVINAPSTLQPYTITAQSLLLADQQAAWNNIKAMRSQIKHGGILVGGKWFHTDEESRSHYATMYAAISVNALPDAYVFDANWKTMDGTMTAMTVAALKALINAGMTSESANYANAEAHRLAMMESADPLAYDFSTGWSAVHPA